MSGFLYVNKPVGPTSHDIVDRVRRLAGVRTVGHAGTLDPFASGLLIVGVGREATREFPHLVGLDKRYVATLHLGATSDTDDRTGRIAVTPAFLSVTPAFPVTPAFLSVTPAKAGVHDPTAVDPDFHRDDIENVLKKFTGKIKQIPPMYSAKKIKGKKLYELARAGLSVIRHPSSVEIYSIEIVEAKPPQASAPEVSPLLVLDIHCSSGTYIRALARDIGEALGCGAYLEELERTAVGPFTLDEAVKMEDLNKENWEKYLISIKETLDRCQRKAGVLG